MAGLFDGTSLERPITCATCGKPMSGCSCPRGKDGQVCRPGDQQARVRREKRNGKWVTVISGLDAAATDLAALTKKVKSQCAAGGTVREDGLEVQGDHRDALVALLKSMGYPAKAAGG